MHDPKASDLKQPYGIALTELLSPRIGVFPGIADYFDVAKLVRGGLAEHKRIQRPRHRASHGFTAIVVVMRVGDKDCIGTDVWREIVSEPNAARVWIDKN